MSDKAGLKTEYRFCVVVDCEFNRVTYPDMIGQVYAANRAPAYARVAVIDRHCWAGGDSPRPGYGCAVRSDGRLRWPMIVGCAGRMRQVLITARVFAGIRSLLFREYVRECGGLDLWECAGTTRWDRARLFWNRATLDAWRTVDRWQ